jgi:hypothetical protein
MQKYATRGHDDIGRNVPRLAPMLQAERGEKLVKLCHVAIRNVLLATMPRCEYKMDG